MSIDSAVTTESIRSALALTRDDFYVDVAITDPLIELVRQSRFELLDQHETSHGVCWSANVTIDDVTMSVENRGDGGSNWYAIAGQPMSVVDQYEQLIAATIPEFDVAPLDLYCDLLDLTQEYLADVLASE